MKPRLLRQPGGRHAEAEDRCGAHDTIAVTEEQRREPRGERHAKHQPRADLAQRARPQRR